LGGAIQQDGAYKYDLPPGAYKVRIESAAPPPPGFREGDPPPAPGTRPQVQEQVPAKYANYETSGLTATIGSESPQQLDFPLK
jgi:hypothetical protein